MVEKILAELDKEKARLLEVVKAYGVQGVDTIHVIDALVIAIKALDEVHFSNDLAVQTSSYYRARDEISKALKLVP